MIFTWLGVALLSVSWLFGLGYYHPVNWSCWAVLVTLGFSCFLALPNGGLPRRRSTGAALLLSAPAIFVAPWPYRAAFLLLLIGLLARLEFLADRVPRRFASPARRLSRAAILTGSLLLVQSLAITWYTSQTSRSHELPTPLPRTIGAIARLLGIDSAVHDNTVALHSMRQIHLLGATWELFLDPATFCFLVAAFTIVIWQSRLGFHQEKSVLLRKTLGLGFSLLAWLHLRVGILMALYLHDALRTDYDADLDAMRLFWNSWVHLLLLAGPVLLCSVFVPWSTVTLGNQNSAVDVSASPRRPRLLTSIAIGLAVNLIAVGIFWDPVGTRQQGRVVVEEHHPDPDEIWERTDKPYDTTWYGQQSGYNYYCIYDYCSRYYSMSRQTEPIHRSALRRCDVLIVKVPTRPFSRTEIRAIREFVADGGGLLLIGEHTNVFRTSDHLNPIARVFGFEFRHDCLFGIDTVYDQRYSPALVPHPIVQNVPWLDFATSCSIRPAKSRGHGVIVDTRLKNLMADYHSDNFYPQPENRADMRYGSFIQLWATKYGKGRVVAFTDSTIFSNFCVFEPGKSELMLGMIEWLNHRSLIASPRPLFLCAGSLLLLTGFWLARRGDVDLLLPMASGLLGWSVAVMAVRAAHQVAMPVPTANRDFVRIVVDRTLCDCPLAKNGFVDGSEAGMGIFERWIPRLGYFTARRRGSRVWDSDVVVFLHPRKPASGDLRRRMVDYVRGGGKVLIVDSARTDSTANGLLEPFALSIDSSQRFRGKLRTDAWPAVSIDDAASVRGGEPFARIQDRPVGTFAREGDGLIVVVGFGSRFNDVNMGSSGDVIPDAELMRTFQLQFELLRWIVEFP